MFERTALVLEMEGVMLEPRHWLKTVGTLSIGGAIGASVGALIYLLLRSYLEGVSIYEVMALLAAIGAGVQRTLQRAGWFLGFFEQLYELGKLKKSGIIKNEQYQEIVNELVKRRFLDK
ncbi:MAG TPA: hypothetical protein VGD41_00945 [Pyrinomonadaceae bacterium]